MFMILRYALFIVEIVEWDDKHDCKQILSKLLQVKQIFICKKDQTKYGGNH